MATLLDKAKSHKTSSRNHRFTKEEEDLALAWMNDEISLSQVMKALESHGGTTSYVFLAQCARQIFQNSSKGKK
jgi:hypothetical protein